MRFLIFTRDSLDKCLHSGIPNHRFLDNFICSYFSFSRHSFFQGGVGRLIFTKNEAEKETDFVESFVGDLEEENSEGSGQ